MARWTFCQRPYKTIALNKNWLRSAEERRTNLTENEQMRPQIAELRAKLEERSRVWAEAWQRRHEWQNGFVTNGN